MNYFEIAKDITRQHMDSLRHGVSTRDAVDRGYDAARATVRDGAGYQPYSEPVADICKAALEALEYFVLVTAPDGWEDNLKGVRQAREKALEVLRKVRML